MHVCFQVQTHRPRHRHWNKTEVFRLTERCLPDLNGSKQGGDTGLVCTLQTEKRRHKKCPLRVPHPNSQLAGGFWKVCRLSLITNAFNSLFFFSWLFLKRSVYVMQWFNIVNRIFTELNHLNNEHKFLSSKFEVAVISFRVRKCEKHFINNV